MADKRFAKNITIIVGISGVLMLFSFVLVSHHREIPERVLQARHTLSAPGSSIAERTKAVGEVHVASAEPRRQPVPVATAAAAEVNGQQIYQSACVACHGAGVAGAPKLGDTGLWAKRIAKGLDTLYANAINGVQSSTGVMPAKGGNPALSNAEVKAAVDYIVARSK